MADKVKHKVRVSIVEEYLPGFDLNDPEAELSINVVHERYQHSADGSRERLDNGEAADLLCHLGFTLSELICGCVASPNLSANLAVEVAKNLIKDVGQRLGGKSLFLVEAEELLHKHLAEYQKVITTPDPSNVH